MEKELYWASGCHSFLLPVLITKFVKERQEGEKREGRRKRRRAKRRK